MRMSIRQDVTPAAVPHRSTIKRTYHRRKPTKQKDIDTVLVVNPYSYRGLTGKGWDDLYSKIKNILGDNIEVAFSKKSGDGTTLTRQFLKKGFKKVVAI